MTHTIPPGYEEKFKNFIRLCTEAKSRGADHVVIGWPRALGDNYDEMTESLSRLVDAGLQLRIATRNDQPSRN